MTNRQLKAKPAEVKCPRCHEWRARKLRPLSADGHVWYCKSCDHRFYVGEVEKA